MGIECAVTIQDVIREERAGILGESLINDPIWGAAPMPYSAVTEPGVLVRTPSFIRRIHPVTLETLPGRDRGMAFVQSCLSLKYKFLWVHADNNDYREDYITFLREIHKVTETLSKELHADHLYNRERAKQLQTPFIRMMLAPQGINTSHGAGYEKARTRSHLGRVGRDHTLDEISLMKACGISSPRKGQPLTADMVAHVQRIAQLYGMKVDDVEGSIRDLMEVAAFKPKG
jgi:hypothetical protein